MKVFFATIMFFVCSTGCHEKSLSKDIFHYRNVVTHEDHFDTLTRAQRLDISFYQSRYLILSTFPSTLKTDRYSDTTIRNWNDPEKAGNNINNWFYESTYNEIRQLIKFSYSSCLICSQFPFTYTISYNSEGLPTKIGYYLGYVVDTHNDRFFVEDPASLHEYVFEYNGKGDIVRVDHIALRDTLESIVKE